MAESSGQERTERATPKRLEEARKKGQVPRSIELSMAAVCIAAATAVYTLGRGAASRLAELMRSSLAIDSSTAVGENVIWPALMNAGSQALLIILPILGATFVAALAAPLAIGGWNFSGQALVPQFSRLNPAAGLGRMFSARGTVELGKGLAKVFVVAMIAWVLLKGMTPQMLGLSSEPLNGAITHAAALAGYALMVLCFGLVAIAAFDVPFQLWQHGRDLKMTREEVREEYKESEGSPETRGRIREAQRALARGRMMQDVPKADVVITNPTHFAVALQIRRPEDARADRRRQGRRSHGGAYSRNRHGKQRPHCRSAAAGARVVPYRGYRPRSAGRVVRDRRPGPDLRLSTQGVHRAGREAAAGAAVRVTEH